MTSELPQRACAACLVRLGYTGREAGTLTGISKSVAERAAHRYTDRQTRIPDRRLYCVDCLLRIGCGINLATRLTGVPKSIVGRYRKRKGYGPARRHQVNLGKVKRDPERVWMERAWAAEWRGVQYIGELRHWTNHEAIATGRSSAMIAYYADLEGSRLRACESAKRRHAAAMSAAQRPMWLIAARLRTRIYYVVKRAGGRKAGRTIELTSCTREALKRWIEEQFEPGMSWANYGNWEIDHVLPCAMFDLRDPRQQRTCFHYTNLQPMWKTENRRKWGRIPTREGSYIRVPFARAREGSAQPHTSRMTE